MSYVPINLYIKDCILYCNWQVFFSFFLKKCCINQQCFVCFAIRQMMAECWRHSVFSVWITFYICLPFHSKCSENLCLIVQVFSCLSFSIRTHLNAKCYFVFSSCNSLLKNINPASFPTQVRGSLSPQVLLPGKHGYPSDASVDPACSETGLCSTLLPSVLEMATSGGEAGKSFSSTFLLNTKRDNK